MKQKQREIPGEMTSLEFNSRNILSTENPERWFDHQRISTQKVLEEWRNGKIICHRCTFPSEDDIEMA